MVATMEKATLNYYSNAAKILRAPIILTLPHAGAVWVEDVETASTKKPVTITT